MRTLSSIVAIATGCSLSVDTSTTQCTVNADCDRFEGHPRCESGLCRPSGLGPPGCFSGEPIEPEEFANRCTTSTSFEFDNCRGLGLCNDSQLADAWNRTAPPAIVGTCQGMISDQPVPTVNCADAGPHLIYLTGSTNLPPLIKAVQPLLSANDPPYVAVFAPQTSCKGAASILDPDPTKHLIKNTPNNYAFYYENDVKKFCLLDAAGVTVDVGESDIYPDSCKYQMVDNTADYLGPIQAITFVVPSRSTQSAISAEAAHLVFGVGGDDAVVTPWTDAHYYFVRSAGTGTMQLTARSINIDPAKVWGMDALSADNLVACMEDVDPKFTEQAIGVLSSDFADKSRGDLRVLPFQERGQRYGYLPDSKAASFDKANVRDGHYPIWGAIHLLASTQNGVPSDAARALIRRLTLPRLDLDMVLAIIKSGFVPSCAMTVNHPSEVGPLSKFTPEVGCACLYEHEVNGKASCAACGAPGDCPSTTPACNYGYCEVQ